MRASFARIKPRELHRIESNCRPNRFLLLNQNLSKENVFHGCNRKLFPKITVRTPNNATSEGNMAGWWMPHVCIRGGLEKWNA